MNIHRTEDVYQDYITCV